MLEAITLLVKEVVEDIFEVYAWRMVQVHLIHRSCTCWEWDVTWTPCKYTCCHTFQETKHTELL